MATRKRLTLSNEKINQGAQFDQIFTEEQALQFTTRAVALGYTIVGSVDVTVPDTVPAITPIREGGSGGLGLTTAQEIKINTAIVSDIHSPVNFVEFTDLTVVSTNLTQIVDVNVVDSAGRDVDVNGIYVVSGTSVTFNFNENYPGAKVILQGI